MYGTSPLGVPLEVGLAIVVGSAVMAASEEYGSSQQRVKSQPKRADRTALLSSPADPALCVQVREGAHGVPFVFLSCLDPGTRQSRKLKLWPAVP